MSLKIAGTSLTLKRQQVKFFIMGAAILVLAAICAFIKGRGGSGEAVGVRDGDATRSVNGTRTRDPARRDSRSHSVMKADRELEKLLFEFPGGLQSLLDSQDQQTRAETLNKCGVLIRAEIEASGDFRKIRRALNGLPKSASKYLMNSWIMRSKSSSGAMADFIGQQEIVRSAGLDKDLSVYPKFLSVTGGLAAASLLPDRGNTGLSVNELSEILNGSVKELGVATSFPLVNMVAEENKEAEARMVGRAVEALLVQDPIKTSELIGNLSKGQGRDAMIHAMVSWLRRNGDEDTAVKWEGDLSSQ